MSVHRSIKHWGKGEALPCHWAVNPTPLFVVALQAKRAASIVHSQESRIDAFVGIVAGSALHIAIEQPHSRQSGGIIQ